MSSGFPPGKRHSWVCDLKHICEEGLVPPDSTAVEWVNGCMVERRIWTALRDISLCCSLCATGKCCPTSLRWSTWMEMVCSVWRSTISLSWGPVERNVTRMPGLSAKVIILIITLRSQILGKVVMKWNVRRGLICGVHYLFCRACRELWYEKEPADTAGLHGAEPDGGHRERWRPCWPVGHPGSHGLQPNAGASRCKLTHLLSLKNLYLYHDVI